MDEDIYPDELYHYGRKGMKWGQHIFGKERSSGTKKRKKSSEDVENRFVSGAKSAASKVATSVSNARTKRKEEKRIEQLHKKDPSKMTNDELTEYINRMNMERTAAQARQQVSQMNPQKVSKGKAFMNSLGRDVIAPAAKNVGRQYLEKVLRDQLGLNDKKSEDPLKKLRDEVDKLNLENKKGALTDSINKRKKEHEEANKKKQEDAKTSDSTSSDTSSKTKSSDTNTTSKSNEPEATYETPSTASSTSSRSSSNSVSAEDVYISSGYSFIEQNRQLLNTPIAGLLQPADDDERRR